MTHSFPVINVSPWPRLHSEQMGTKEKFWCRSPHDDGLWLFKYSRSSTGEDWSEKIAAEIAGRIGLPHAIVELASCEGRRGSLSLDFTNGRSRGVLVHGNELLLELDPAYPRQKRYHLGQHTLDRVFQALDQPFVHLPDDFVGPSVVETPVDLFVGYLMLDALIGNVDRHHENWAIIERQPATRDERHAELAPTFDHASSLGRELEDKDRSYKLSPGRRDQTIDGYLDRARSAIYAGETAVKPVSPIEAFELAAKQRGPASRAWLERLAQVPLMEFNNLVDRVPVERMSTPARKFALRLLELTRSKLLSKVDA